MFSLTGCGEVWYRAWFGSKRPRVRIPTLRPTKKALKLNEFQGFFFLVGAPGFEPGASWTRTKRDTKLRHAPIAKLL